MDQYELRARNISGEQMPPEDGAPVDRVSAEPSDADVESLASVRKMKDSATEFKGRHIQMMALCMQELNSLLTA